MPVSGLEEATVKKKPARPSQTFSDGPLLE
jgi:hypothetical protein